MKLFEPSGNRWRVLFMDRQGQILAASPLLPGLVEAQIVADRGVKGSGDVAVVQVVQVRREGRVDVRTSSSLILP